MSFMSKLKDFFYDEEEIEEEVIEEKKEIKKPSKKINIYDIENEKNKVEKKTEDLSERELFKAERTFNFPVDFDDEPDFEPVNKKEPVEKSIKQEKKENNINVNRSTRHMSSSSNSTNRYNTSNYSSVDRSPMIHKKEEKTFQPTPIISPIYGILNKNYEKDDITERKQPSKVDKDEKVDFDSVRRKAYAELDEELEKTFNDVKKGIFYNLDEEEKKEEVKPDDIKDEFEEEPYKKDEVVITYEQVDPDDSSEEDEDDIELEVPKITRSKTKKKVEKSLNLDIDEEPESNEEDTDSKILEDTQEQDLFNLIDNMYSDDEEEEDE